MEDIDLRRVERHPMTLAVMIYRHGHPVGVGFTRDAGAGGAFIVTGAPALMPGAPIELEFELDAENGLQCFRVPAWITHRPQSGVGVTFSHLDSPGRRAFCRAVRH